MPKHSEHDRPRTGLAHREDARRVPEGPPRARAPAPVQAAVRRPETKLLRREIPEGEFRQPRWSREPPGTAILGRVSPRPSKSIDNDS